MWIQNAWEMIGTTQVDLNDYVKFTDYATGSKAGVIKPGNGIALSANGFVIGVVRNLTNYVSDPTTYIISKGTLESIKANYVKEGMAANMSYDEETETLTITTE